jgi:hypothetical protein
MRVVRACHPEVTIILPTEKIPVRPGDDVRAMITPYVAIIRHALNSGKYGSWNGDTGDCRTKQVRHILGQYFYFYSGSITEKQLSELLDDLLYIHKAQFE